MSEQPEYLYKYSTVERAKEVLTESKIFFPCPADFNDPFDCRFHATFRASSLKRERYARELLREKRPDLPRNIRKKIAKHANRAMFEKSPEQFMARVSRLGMLCLSARRESVLMWSHYSEKHSGICLEFRHLALTGPGERRIVPLPVTYSDDYPVVDYFEMEPFVGRWDDLALAKQKEMVERIYLTKARDWNYECEWRVIDFRGPGRGFRPISPDWLTGVIFGCKTPESHKEKIRQWISQGSTRPKLYQAEQSATSFTLDIVEIL